MTHSEKLTAILAAVQVDPGNRGLARLFHHFPHDFEAACRSIAEHSSPSVQLVTGFWIPTAEPPCHETDGPLGVVHLAKVLHSLGGQVEIITDHPCNRPIEEGLQQVGLGRQCKWEDLPAGLSDEEIRERHWPKVWVKTIPGAAHPWDAFLQLDWLGKLRGTRCTHVIAIERSGPGTDGVCRTMRGREISRQAPPAYLLFEGIAKSLPDIVTIGIGDGGNEIGMGKLPHELVAECIPNGDLIHCRTPTDHLIVAGVSNWGAYALAAGILVLRDARPPAGLFDPDRERAVLEAMVKAGPLVDGVTGKQTATVDGLTWEEYVKPLVRIGEILEAK